MLSEHYITPPLNDSFQTISYSCSLFIKIQIFKPFLFYHVYLYIFFYENHAMWIWTIYQCLLVMGSGNIIFILQI